MPKPIQKLLVKIGVTALISLLGLVVALYLLHQCGAINAWQFPLKRVSAFLGGIGLTCLLLSFVLRIRPKKRIIRVVLIAILTINAIAYIGAYALTHYISLGQLGLGMPRPTNPRLPSDVGLEYVTQRIPINQTEWIETWFIPAQSSSSKGTVLLFPGNGGSKGKQLLAPAQVFHDLNYDALLIDFRGVSGSSGSTTTLGFWEAKDVILVRDRAKQLNLKHPIIFYGVSMGSAAILKAVAQENIAPDAIILELPFARLLNAVKSRLQVKNVPLFPTAELLVFWGSIQHGFNGFAHNPVTYAKQIKCPTLVLQGERDKWTTMTEINELFQNLRGSKQLVIFPTAGHQLLVSVDRHYWQKSVNEFLKNIT